jgi:hypothetical protein
VKIDGVMLVVRTHALCTQLFNKKTTLQSIQQLEQDQMSQHQTYKKQGKNQTSNQTSETFNIIACVEFLLILYGNMHAVRDLCIPGIHFPLPPLPEMTTLVFTLGS